MQTPAVLMRDGVLLAADDYGAKPGTSFWRETSAEGYIHFSNLPVQIMSGYYDVCLHDAVEDFPWLIARTFKAPAQLIPGPWTHGSAAHRRTQELDFRGRLGAGCRTRRSATRLHFLPAYDRMSSPEEVMTEWVASSQPETMVLWKDVPVPHSLAN